MMTTIHTLFINARPYVKARAYEHNSKLRRPQGLEKPPRLDLHRGRKGKLR